jgi:hypothetical protein
VGCKSGVQGWSSDRDRTEPPPGAHAPGQAPPRGGEGRGGEGAGPSGSAEGMASEEKAELLFEHL